MNMYVILYMNIIFTCNIQPIIFGVSFNRILQSQSNRSLFNKTRQKRRRKLETRLSFEIREMTLQLQKAVHQVQELDCYMSIQIHCAYE